MDKGISVIINNNHGKILVLKRSPFEFYYPNFWDLPGGKIESGETLQEAAIRETEEESGLKIKLENKYFYFYSYNDKDLDIYSFRAQLINDEVMLSKEHAEFRWISKDEWQKLEYTPSVGETIKEFFK